MRFAFHVFTLLFIVVIVSCKGKDKTSVHSDSKHVSNDSMPPHPGSLSGDSTLTPYKSFIENGLEKWAGSFRNFSIDSFRVSQQSSFGEEQYDGPADLHQYYEFYKASLSYSRDSSQFIDLYSSGVMLEKRGKKIIASADADQAVSLTDTRAGVWKRIAFFGPSAGIEESIWISNSIFILAGSMHNDNGDPQAFIMVGDVNRKTFRWFESGLIRPQSVKYEASGLAKLKIDEWE